MLPKHLRGLSQRRAENIKHSNSLTRIPGCLSMPRRSCQRLIPVVLMRHDKGEEQKYRYIYTQFVTGALIDGENRWREGRRGRGELTGEGKRGGKRRERRNERGVQVRGRGRKIKAKRSGEKKGRRSIYPRK